MEYGTKNKAKKFTTVSHSSLSVNPQANSKRMSYLSPALLILVAIAAFFGHQIYRDHWYKIDQLNIEKFEQKAVFNKVEIPTTYYSKGQIKNVLQKVSHNVDNSMCSNSHSLSFFLSINISSLVG